MDFLTTPKSALSEPQYHYLKTFWKTLAGGCSSSSWCFSPKAKFEDETGFANWLWGGAKTIRRRPLGDLKKIVANSPWHFSTCPLILRNDLLLSNTHSPIGHYYFSLSDKSSKKGKKGIFGVFRLFWCLCHTASQPHRLSQVNALRIN